MVTTPSRMRHCLCSIWPIQTLRPKRQNSYLMLQVSALLTFSPTPPYLVERRPWTLVFVPLMLRAQVRIAVQQCSHENANTTVLTWTTWHVEGSSIFHSFSLAMDVRMQTQQLHWSTLRDKLPGVWGSWTTLVCYAVHALVSPLRFGYGPPQWLALVFQSFRGSLCR